MKRGLVISTPVTVSGKTLVAESVLLDPQDLRASLLFWDKLEMPKSMLSLDNDPIVPFLQRTGILQRTTIQPTGAFDMAEAVLAIFMGAYRLLDEKEPGVWAVGCGKNTVAIPQAELERGRGILVRLHQAIPVPDKDVPIDDILEFKQKRAAELLALRAHLDAVYQRILLNVGDRTMAIETEVAILDQAIADYMKASASWGRALVSMSLDTSLNLPAGVQAAVATYSQTLDLSAALISGSAAAISFGPTNSLKGRPHGATNPFQYIKAYHSRVF